MNQQILFSSEDQSQQTFENFYPAENQNVLLALKNLIQIKDEFGCLYIYGESGSGKTHLLQSAINDLTDEAVYLDLNADVNRLKISAETKTKLIALDNFEALSHHESEMMLVFETLKLHSAKLIVASILAPKALSLKLKDLTSRLLSGHVFELKMLSDEQKIEALKYRARLRGFDLSDEVIQYVINRYPRDFKTLFGLLDKIDDASISNQRKVTVPFIKELEC